MTQNEAIDVMLTDQPGPADAVTALAVFGIGAPTVADALVVCSLYRRAVTGADISAIRFWLANRSGDQWSTRSRRPNLNEPVPPADATPEPPAVADPLSGLRLVCEKHAIFRPAPMQTTACLPPGTRGLRGKFLDRG